MITGRNIGAEQREPEWTTEQLEVIDKAKRVILPVMPVDNTRRSVMENEWWISIILPNHSENIDAHLTLFAMLSTGTGTQLTNATPTTEHR